jgi:hypothetical protein
LEFLEGRTTPSNVDMWTGADAAIGNYNWSDANNWTNGAPTASSIVEFTSNSSVKWDYPVVDQNFTVAGLQMDASWGGTLSVNNNTSLTLASGSVNEWDSGYIGLSVLGGSLVNNGTLTLNNFNPVLLYGGGTFQNNGTVNQTNAGSLQLTGSSTNVPTTLVNAAGATWDFQTDSGIVSTVFNNGGLLHNTGLIEKTAGSGTSAISAPLTNNGGTLYAASGTLGIDAYSTDNSGTFQAAAGATLDLTDASSYAFTENGTFTGAGAGTIVLDNGALATGPTGATFNIPSTTFDWSGGDIYVPTNAILAYNGTLTLNNFNPVLLDGGGTLQNNGTINQQGAGKLAISGTNTVATTLANAATATYDFQSDAGIVYGGGVGAVVTNAGLIKKTAGSGTSAISASLTNNGGTLYAASGTLGIDAYSTDNSGTFQAATGATLDLTGGYGIAETGTLTAAGTGTVTLGGGTLAVANNAVSLSLPSLPSTFSFQWPGSTIDVPTNDTLTVNGNLTFNGTSNEYLTGGGTMTENGTITQSGTGSFLIAGTNNVATTLVLPKGSIYDFTNNSGIGNGGGQGGVIDNSGTIEKTGGGALSWLNVALNNTGGTLAATTGTLTLDTTGGENTGGAFSVAAGAVVDLTGGNWVNYTGTWTGSGSGEVLLDGGTLNVTGGTNGATFNLPGNLFVWTGGTISTAAANNFTLLGNLKITGNGTEYLQGGGELNIGTASAAGALNDTGTANNLYIGGGSTLGINNRGTLNLADDAITGPGLLVDQGSLVKTAGTSGATISTTVDSPGKVTVNNGTLLFNGVVDQVFNGVLTGGTWTAFSTATTASTLDISSATFNTIGVSASVILSGPHSSFSNLSGLVANQGTFNLSSGASFATAGNFTNSGSMTLSAGSVLSVNGAFAQTSTGKLTEQIGGTAASPTFGSVVSTGAVSLGGTLSVTSTVVVPVNPNVGYEILNNESASPISGTFAGLPEGATFTVKVGTTTMTFKITYVGGPGGKNVVITRIS